MSENNRPAAMAERNAQSFERIAAALESLALFLQVLLSEDGANPAANVIMTHNGPVEMR